MVGFPESSWRFEDDDGDNDNDDNDNDDNEGSLFDIFPSKLGKSSSSSLGDFVPPSSEKSLSFRKLYDENMKHNKTIQQIQEDDNSKDGSIQLHGEKNDSSKHSDGSKHNDYNTEKPSSSKKSRRRWLGGLFRRKKNRQEEDDDDAQDDDDDEPKSMASSSQDSQSKSSSKPEKEEHDNDDDDDNSQDSNVPTAKVVETYPDSENEFHQVIRNQNWDLLEILLKEYDYKKYTKPKEPKKPARKLRVAKYLPEMPTWRKPVEVPKSPLYGLDDLGRAPLHLCCIADCPDKPLLRLLFCARDIASVSDATGSLPIHLAVTHDKGVDVIDKLIRGYYQGAMEPDGTKRTPLMWAIEMIKRQRGQDQQTADKTLSANHTYWAHPPTKEAATWQAQQVEIWKLVQFMLDNRVKRRQKIQPREYRQIVQAMGLAAPPQVVSLFLHLGQATMKKEAIAGPALSICITRQYPLELLETLVEALPMDFAKEHKDTTGRGVVAAHYRIGCMTHPSTDDESKRESFRIIMQKLANAVGNLQEDITPPKEYLEWWEKLKFLINLWGSYTLEDDASHNDFDMDDLLLHNALSNPDVPPSLIRLLASLRPQATDLEHPKSTALPIHLACRVWRYRHFPPRKGEKELHMDKVVLQLLEGDYSRTKKRYRDRLPIHHAAASGKNWQFLKPLVVHDRKSLQVRDPNTKLYPFQQAASNTLNFDIESLARRLFTAAQWKKLTSDQQVAAMLGVKQFYEVEQLTSIFELLRYGPQSIDHGAIQREAAEQNAARPKRKIIMEEVVATDEVALSTQTKMIRAMFGVGNVAGHFIAWAYENTRRGWKTHRSNFGVLKEAIMDGLIPTAMDRWWRKLKVWIWQDCPWESPAIPRRDDFLLHGALCNPDTSPWIIELLLECFPRSASIPLPNSDGCYPLHIASVTDRYVGLSFEFPNKKTVIEMTVKAYPDAALLKWKTRLPLHLAIVHGKDWEEIRYLVDEEPVALGVADPKLGFFPFQLMAMNRPYSKKQRSYFEMVAQKEVGKQEWKALSAHEKVVHMSRILEDHEYNSLGGVWELLKRNPVLVSVGIADNESSYASKSMSSDSGEEFTMALKNARVNMSISASSLMETTVHGLSMASLDFLDDVYEKDTQKTAARRNRENSRSSLTLSFEGSISDPFIDSSFRVRPSKPSSTLSLDYKPGKTALPHAKEGKPPLPPAKAEEEFEFIEYVIEDEGEDDISQYEYLYQEVVEAETSAAATGDQIGVQKQIEYGPYDHKLLCYPRRKDIMLIRNGKGHVIWRNATLQSGVLKESPRRNYWAQVLQQLGEPVDLGGLHLIRHEEEQRLLGSVNVDETTILIDEDNTYVWVLCGEDACGAAEGYDVEAAIIVTSSLLDRQTGVWLSPFLTTSQSSKLSAKRDPHIVLEWILRTSEETEDDNQIKPYWISRGLTRRAFTRDLPGEAPNTTIERASRRLWFDVARAKMQVKFKRRQFIGVRYFAVRGAIFGRQREKFYENQKKVRFFKRLRKKQRHAARQEGEKHGSSRLLDHSLSSDVASPQHMKEVRQIGAKVDDSGVAANKDSGEGSMRLKNLRQRRGSVDQGSTNARDLHQPTHADDIDKQVVSQVSFPELKVLPHDKPLLAAAVKAEKETEGRSSIHLLHLQQPKDLAKDKGTLASVDLFDPSGPPPENPLSAAALKDKQQAEEATLGATNNRKETRRRARRNRSAHLKGMHQPTTISEDDNVSLEAAEVFDPPRERPPDRPLLAAALKAKEQKDNETRFKMRQTIKSGQSDDNHLQHVHQPKLQYDDDISLAQADVFDPPKDPPPQKPLLAAALKAKKQQERLRESSSPSGQQDVPSHLLNAHQPATLYEDDEASLAMGAVFDPPRPPPPLKPLLAAAMKAKEEMDRGCFRSPRRTKSILKASHFTSPSAGDSSIDLAPRVATPSKSQGPPANDETDTKRPAPMTAKLVKMSSVERLLSQENSSSIPAMIETSPGPHRKRLDSNKSKKRSSGAKKPLTRSPAKLEQPQRGNSK